MIAKSFRNFWIIVQVKCIAREGMWVNKYQTSGIAVPHADGNSM